jgi:hypothetical protein
MSRGGRYRCDRRTEHFLARADNAQIERARHLARANLARLQAQAPKLPQTDYTARPLEVPLRSLLDL